MASTPATGSLNDHISPTDEKMFLHTSMALALIPRNNGNIDDGWSPEQLKEALDNSKIVAEAGLPPLDTVIVAQALGKWQRKLGDMFGLKFIEDRVHRGNLIGGVGDEKAKTRAWRIKFSDYMESAGLGYQLLRVAQKSTVSGRHSSVAKAVRKVSTNAAQRRG